MSPRRPQSCGAAHSCRVSGGDRESMTTTMLVWIFGEMFVFLSMPTESPRMHDILTVMILGLIAGVLSIWWINHVYRRKRMRLHQAIRDDAQAERAKQLQEAVDKGDFDRWDNTNSRLSPYSK